MRRLSKKSRKLIFATIPAAFVLSGAAAGAGAGSEGLTMILSIIVALGSMLYAFIVFELLAMVEELDAEIEKQTKAERERIFFETRNIYNCR